jgi:hypothetical protein
MINVGCHNGYCLWDTELAFDTVIIIIIIDIISSTGT